MDLNHDGNPQLNGSTICSHKGESRRRFTLKPPLELGEHRMRQPPIPGDLSTIPGRAMLAKVGKTGEPFGRGDQVYPVAAARIL